MEDITTYDILNVFGIKSSLLFDERLRTKEDILRVIRFCIFVCKIFTEEDDANVKRN